MSKAIDKQYLIDSLKGFDSNILEAKYLQALGIQKNGTDLVADANGKINIVVDAAVEYRLAAQGVPESGFLATYTLQANTGTNGAFEDVEDDLGNVVKINIPKDYLVKSVSQVLTVTAADKAAADPVAVPAVEEGKFYNNANFLEGDKYVDFTINTIGNDGTESHLYINLKDLYNPYTAGNGIALSSGAFSAAAKTNGGLDVDAGGIFIDFEDYSTNPIDFATEYNTTTP